MVYHAVIDLEESEVEDFDIDELAESTNEVQMDKIYWEIYDEILDDMEILNQ